MIMPSSHIMHVWGFAHVAMWCSRSCIAIEQLEHFEVVALMQHACISLCSCSTDSSIVLADAKACACIRGTNRAGLQSAPVRCLADHLVSSSNRNARQQAGCGRCNMPKAVDARASRDAGRPAAATPAQKPKVSRTAKADSRPVTPATPAATANVPRNQSDASLRADSAEPRARMTRSRSQSVGMASMAVAAAAEAAAAEPEVVDLCGTSSDQAADDTASPEASDSQVAASSEEDVPVMRELPHRWACRLNALS